MQHPSPVDPARQDLGIYSDIAMAPQPPGLSGPMAQGHLMTIEITIRRLDTFSSTEDERSRSAVLLRFLCEQYSKGLQSGSIIFGKNPICQHTTSLSEFIAKQVRCRSGLFLKREPNANTLLLDTKMMV